MSEPFHRGGNQPEAGEEPEPETPPAEEVTQTGQGGTGSHKKETRYEIGFFVRKAEDQSSTPPDYPSKPPDGSA